MGPRLLLFFVIGDILGTGIYGLTGQVGGQVGGAIWLPFLIAFIVALLTATSYVELVGKYPQAAGAALYTHRAFRVPFLTFLVAFAVMCSGVTSASAAARAFGGNYFKQFINWPTLLVALGFIMLLALINLRGVAESVKANVVLTSVELSGLLIILVIGLAAFAGGDGDPSRLVDFKEGQAPITGIISGAALAFFAMVGFEDSVNMAEECKEPQKTFPRALFLGITITGCIYLLVALIASLLVPVATLQTSDSPLLEVVKAGAPGFPLKLFAFIALFAVTNSALINMMMASRLLYGMANERIIPRLLGIVHPRRRTPWVAILFTTVIALGVVGYGTDSPRGLATLGGTTSLLLLGVFTIVNTAVLVLRRSPVEHPHYRAPTFAPMVAAIVCLYLASPLSGRPAAQYKLAGVLIGIGIVLYLINWAFFGRQTAIDARRLTKGGAAEN
jgi:amino acid transporter